MADDKLYCALYGDCPHNCFCEVDEPWAKCRHRILPSQQIADLQAQVAEKDRVIKVLAERCNELIEDPNPAQGAPVNEWIQWAEAKAKEGV